eukprot:scaffold9143_cov80-Skeletonema_menzelii.AAC.1
MGPAKNRSGNKGGNSMKLSAKPDDEADPRVVSVDACRGIDWQLAVDFDGTDSIIAVPPDALNIPIPQYFGCCCKMLIMPSRTEFDEFGSDK